MRYLIDIVEATGKVPKRLVQAVKKWQSNNAVWPLSGSDIADLKRLNVRPEEPVVLYRGLLFSTDARAAAFRERIEHGDLRFTMTWHRPSSWSTQAFVADGFARKANLGDDNLLGQIHNDARWQGSEIDGVLGVVLKTTAQPDQIICALDMLGGIGEFDHENEFILDVGPLDVEIIQAFDSRGEIKLTSR